MARKKKHAPHENHERWLVSYADFITLMFAFFVVMFASSQTDKGKAQQVSESVRNAIDQGKLTAAVAAILGGTVEDRGRGSAQMKGPGGVQKAKTGNEDGVVNELVPALDFLTKELDTEIREGKMQVSMEPRGLVVTFRQAAFFASGEDVIKPETLGTIEKVARTVEKLTNPVRMEGHTDSVPIHNSRFRSNWELSAARSIAMLEVFAGRFAVPRKKLSIAAYADNAPVDSNESEEGRARNRRVDIVILNQVGMRAEPRPGEDAAEETGERPGKSTPRGSTP